MYCPYCGSRVKDGIRFCPKCGSPLGNSDHFGDSPNGSAGLNRQEGQSGRQNGYQNGQPYQQGSGSQQQTPQGQRQQGQYYPGQPGWQNGYQNGQPYQQGSGSQQQGQYNPGQPGRQNGYQNGRTNQKRGGSQQTPYTGTGSAAPKKNGNCKWWIILVAVILVVCLAGIGVFVFLRRSGTSRGASENQDGSTDLGVGFSNTESGIRLSEVSAKSSLGEYSYQFSYDENGNVSQIQYDCDLEYHEPVNDEMITNIRHDVYSYGTDGMIQSYRSEGIYTHSEVDSSLTSGSYMTVELEWEGNDKARFTLCDMDYSAYVEDKGPEYQTNQVVELTIASEYDSAGRLVSQNYYDEDGAVRFSFVRSYDENGRLTDCTSSFFRKISRSATADEEPTITWEEDKTVRKYTYDESGNAATGSCTIDNENEGYVYLYNDDGSISQLISCYINDDGEILEYGAEQVTFSYTSDSEGYPAAASITVYNAVQDTQSSGTEFSFAYEDASSGSSDFGSAEWQQVNACLTNFFWDYPLNTWWGVLVPELGWIVTN